MLKDIQNSIKAKLYDFTYSPFMSSMIISWIIINHKYILIYMASYDLDKKLKLLESHDFSLFHIPFAMNFWLPIGFGLFYTFLYPLASKWFYEYTLNSNKKLKVIKQKIEDKTPLTQKEAQTIREGNNKLELEVDKLNKEIAERRNLDELTKIEREIIKSLINNTVDEQIIFLKYLNNNSNKSYTDKESLIDGVISSASISISREKVETIFFSLKKQYILNEQDNRIHVTITGLKTLSGLFD